MVDTNLEQQITNTESQDGTIRLTFPDKYITVLIPSQNNKWAVCISSQVGCPVGCKFCYTGKFVKNLSKEEIISQFTVAQAILNEKHNAQPTSIVCMGMGEPMFNFRNVDAALRAINKQFGLSFKHMTLSTSGFYLERLLDVPYHVALSLHTPFTKRRQELMPMTKTVPELVKFAQDYSNTRKFGLMLQYALMKGVNDQPEDIQELLRLDWPKNIFINLIEYNNKGEFVKSDKLMGIKEQIRAAGYKCFIRQSRGSDIEAACGMLEVPDTQ